MDSSPIDLPEIKSWFSTELKQYLDPDDYRWLKKQLNETLVVNVCVAPNGGTGPFSRSENHLFEVARVLAPVLPKLDQAIKLFAAETGATPGDALRLLASLDTFLLRYPTVSAGRSAAQWRLYETPWRKLLLAMVRRGAVAKLGPSGRQKASKLMRSVHANDAIASILFRVYGLTVDADAIGKGLQPSRRRT